MFQRFQAIGRIGKEIEVRRLESGITVAKASLAVSESYKDKDGNKQEKTHWFNLVLWRNLAEVAEKYVKKGHLVFIEGKVETREYEDKDGVKRYLTEIICSELKMLERRDSDNGHNSAPATQPEPVLQDAGNQIVDTDLPF